MIRAAPRHSGVVELIARRPAVGEREVVDSALLTPEEGLVGDSWSTRTHRGGKPSAPRATEQVTLMSARAIAAIVPQQRDWAQAGDQLYVDLDLSIENLPPGTRLALGSAVIEVTEPPHTGCAKFVERFGQEAMRFVNSSLGRSLRLRGMCARVVVPGTVHPGDPIRKVSD